MSVQVSLFASAVRPAIWPALFNSLEGTSVEYEVVFAGNVQPHEDKFPIVQISNKNWHSKLLWIRTGNIKPAQCYEISRRHCTGG